MVVAVVVVVVVVVVARLPVRPYCPSKGQALDVQTEVPARAEL
jgi:hypothetical protein